MDINKLGYATHNNMYVSVAIGLFSSTCVGVPWLYFMVKTMNQIITPENHTDHVANIFAGVRFQMFGLNEHAVLICCQQDLYTSVSPKISLPKEKDIMECFLV